MALRSILVLLLVSPLIASAEEPKPPPFKVRLPGNSQPTDRQLERAVQNEQLEFYVRERVERENDSFLQPYQSQQQNTSPMGSAIFQAFENQRVESEVNKAIRDAGRR